MAEYDSEPALSFSRVSSRLELILLLLSAAPLNLFRANGIFRSMCDRSNISEQDITTTSFA